MSLSHCNFVNDFSVPMIHHSPPPKLGSGQIGGRPTDHDDSSSTAKPLSSVHPPTAVRVREHPRTPFLVKEKKSSESKFLSSSLSVSCRRGEFIRRTRSVGRFERTPRPLSKVVRNGRGEGFTFSCRPQGPFTGEV